MMLVESMILSPSRSRTGSVPFLQKAIAFGPPGRRECRRWRTPLWSSAQRAFSLKFEKLYCQRTGAPLPLISADLDRVELDPDHGGPAQRAASDPLGDHAASGGEHQPIHLAVLVAEVSGVRE